jgi:predicted DNA-binding ribbon-helix-helix protein
MGDNPKPSRLVNRNVQGTNGRTSMRLEPEVWDAIGEMCRREGMTHKELIPLVEATHKTNNLTSAVRAHVLCYFRAAATEEGHKAAGHGAARPSA